MNDEFYLGWEAKAPPGLARRTRILVLTLLLLALLAAATLAISQRLIGTAVFEWGNIKNFSGIMQARPYPMLLVPRPGHTEALPLYSTYYLVAPWKFGLDPSLVAPLDGKPVTLSGTLIYRGNQTMIEAKPETIHAIDAPPNHQLGSGELLRAPDFVPPLVSLGRQTLTGEIVDSKCFFGVMNPGQLAPHRACAIRCISGGVPPVFVVRQADGSAIYLLLVSADGKAVNKEVLDKVAEPLEITGEVERQGDLLILRSDPATYRSL